MIIQEDVGFGHLERIVPTKETLEDFFKKYPDHQQRYQLAADFISGKVVADVACGVGYGSHLLAKTAATIDGFDIDDSALQHAKVHFSADNINFKNISAGLGIDRYEVVVSFETIEHLNEVDGDEFLTNIHRSLKKDGLLILSTPLNRGRNKINVTPYHLREYDDNELCLKLNSAGFEIVRWYGQSNAVVEKLEKKLIGNFSIRRMMRLGVHQLIPKFVRNFIIKEMVQRSSNSLTIVPDDLSNAFVQIAFCRKLHG